jgi:hypothetical protein
MILQFRFAIFDMDQWSTIRVPIVTCRPDEGIRRERRNRDAAGGRAIA